ncbi:hypothetical protein KAI87_17695, partial [Myxococcota bacterium]|nr:hypothetical protein [Myxococcota bacterium]
KDQMVGIGTTDPAGMLHVGHGFSYAKVGPLGILADMAGDRCACDDEADTANVDCEDAFDSVDDQGDFCWDSQAGGFAQFERQQFQGFIITDSGNVGIANQNPSTTLQVGTSFSVDAQASVTQTSRYVKEFSGVITSPSCDPDIATIATIGRITDSTYESFVEITLFGSHRGYQRSTSYFDYKKWVVLFGDKVSANLVGSAGAGNKVGLFNGAATGDYDNIEIDTGFDIRLKAEPQCGSHLRYTYVVRYYSGANFTPDAKRVW